MNNADNHREEFETLVFNDYFVKGITFKAGQQLAETQNNLFKTELCKRDGDDYAREEISAMWNAWKLAVKYFDKQS